MGSPEFSLPSLKALNETYQITGVVNQPDRPFGRGRMLTPPPVKVLARELGLPIFQPRRLREPDAMNQIRSWQPDLIVVAAFGQILRADLLNLPKYGCVNVHASLLPKWRGAAPIPAAIASGDTVTGVTIMCMDEGVDTGPWLAKKPVPILDDDTGETLSTRLSLLGASLLIETLPGYLNGTIQPKIQDDAAATYAPMLKKEDGLIDFTLSTDAIIRKIRAYQPWPGAYFFLRTQPFKILQARATSKTNAGVTDSAPGTLARVGGFPAVVTVDGVLILEIVQPAGKRQMPGKDFLRGINNWGGEIDT